MSMPTATSPDFAHSCSSTPQFSRSDYHALRSSRRLSLSRSSSYSSLHHSATPHPTSVRRQNTAELLSRSPNKLKKDKGIFGYPPTRTQENRPPVVSRRNTMPIAQHPYYYTPSEYNSYSYDGGSHSMHTISNHAVPVSFDWGVRGENPPVLRNSTSASTADLHSPFHGLGTTDLTSSSDYLHASSLRHRRSRSYSLLLLSQQDRGVSQPYPSQLSSSGRDKYSSTRGHVCPRAASLSHSPSVRPRTSSMCFSQTPKFNVLDSVLSRKDSRRVRFLIPGTLHKYLSDPPYRISIKRPPPSSLEDYYYPYLCHSATRPTVSFLLITTPHLPWSIRLCAQPLSEFPSSTYHTTPLAYLTVHDVLTGIYRALRKCITLEEYQSLAPDTAFCNAVVAAYRKRKAQEAHKLPGVQESMRRIDWLAGRTIFEGLERSEEGEGVWRLKLGWKKST